MKVEISYNPYYFKTKIKVDGEDVRENTSYKKINDRINANMPLQSWIDESHADSSWKGLLEELVQESGEVNVRFTFKGRKIDFKDFKESIIQQNKKSGDKYCTTFIEKITLDDSKLSKDIKYVVSKMLTDDFAAIVKDNSLATPELVKKYASLKEDYEYYKNKEFKIVFSGLMSSGKSTLINALIGRIILPTTDDTCTSRVLKIRHNKEANENIFLRCRDERDEIVVKKESYSNDADIMIRLKEICPNDGKFKTNPETVETIELEMNLGHLYPNDALQEQFTIVIVDTPGTDSGVGNRSTVGKTHEEITLDAICDQDKEMVVFVVDAAKKEDEGVSDFLDAIEKQSKEQENIGFNDRFLFLLNKCDKSNYNDDENLAQRIEDYSNYLRISEDGEERKILSPRVFPICAYPALAVKKGITDKSTQTTNEMINMAKAYCDFKDECMHAVEEYSKNYKLDLYAAIPEYQKEELCEKYEDKDYIEKTFLHTGIPSLEYAIKKYIERYAYPLKANALMDTFESILTQLKTVMEVQHQKVAKRIEEIANVETRKKEDEERKVGEKEYNQKLQDAEKKIEELLVEVRKINPNYNIIREIRAEQDKAFINADVKAVLSKKTYTSKSSAEKVLSGAYKTIYNTINLIKGKAIEIEEDAFTKKNGIISTLKEITKEIENCLPENEQKWLTNSVVGKNILKLESLSALKGKIQSKSRTVTRRNPEKDVQYRWWQIGKKINQWLEPDTISYESTTYNLNAVKEILTGLNKDISLFINSLNEQLDSIATMRDYVAEAISKIKTEIKEHRKRESLFEENIKGFEKNINELEKIKAMLEKREKMVNELYSYIKNIVILKEEG